VSFQQCSIQMRVKISHQLPNYLPNNEVKYLFLGTFNPEGGSQVSVHYGREKNQTWKILSRIFEVQLDPLSEEMNVNMRKLGIYCVDLIQAIEVPIDLKPKIIGQGYSDSILFKQSIKRSYIDVVALNAFLELQPNICVFSTWGRGPQNMEWQNLVRKINANIVPLVSPSMAARVPKGVKKYEYMLSDWRRKIIG